MKQSKTEVTVILPVYNSADTLERAITSVFVSTIPVSLIVVNDGSTDNSLQVLKKVASQYNFELISQPNQGLGSARCVGSENVTTEWLTYLDADDECEPDRFERQLEVAKKIGRHKLLFCGTLQKYQNGTTRQKCCYAPEIDSTCITERFINSKFLPSGASMFVHKSDYDKIGGFLPQNRRGCELSLHTRAVAAGFTFHSIPEPLYIQHCSPTSNTNQPTGRLLAARMQIEEWQSELVKCADGINKERLYKFIRSRTKLELAKSLKWPKDIRIEIFNLFGKTNWIYRHEYVILFVLGRIPLKFSIFIMKSLHKIRQLQKRLE